MGIMRYVLGEGKLVLVCVCMEVFCLGGRGVDFKCSFEW